MGHKLLFTPDADAPTWTTLADPPTLESLQEAVGGYIELLRQWRTPEGMVQIFCNEDGQSMGLPQNPAATLWVTQNMPGPGLRFPPGGMLLGNMVVLVGDDAVIS